MPLLRRHRRLASWVTLVTLVLATLAPGMARALAHLNGDAQAMAQVCSAYSQPRGNGPAAPGTDAAHLLAHCPFCALHTDTLGMPPAAAACALPPALREAVPPLLLHAPNTLFAWAPAQARAPPVQG
ncbi:MAG: DUF2946 domain-containing protein [Burkholderiales bacterium]|nr:DUF2946 domain-containing protein [Burkholderiales bacterium]